uniref:Septin-type G domain-containing protein n=1 Tax=Caenorhabditis japonica TaxID=281687 RepID=A0A8R1HVG4_CAEJA
MSRVGSVSINLDDVFGGLPVLKLDSGNRSRKSTESSVSTIKAMPVGRSVVSSHVSNTPVTHSAPVATAPPPVINATPISHYYDATPSSDPLLDTIFSAVSLPPVNLGGHDDALRHLDEALDGEDNESIVSEPAFRAPSSHVSSHAPSHVSHVSSKRSQYASEHHPQNAQSVVSNGSAKREAAARTASIIANNVFDDLNIASQNNNYKVYNAYGDEPQADYDDEKSDHFDLHHQYPAKNLITRDRSNTIDSSASYAESRFGQFDVHDDHDRYHGEEINLHHNEVAYERPDSGINSSPGSVHSHYTQASFHTGGTQKLRNLQRQVEDAHSKRAQLSHQIERQRADNNRLSNANLAREASLKVHNIGQGAKAIGHHVRSYSHEQDNHRLPPRSKSSQSSRSIDSSIYEEEEVRISPLAAKQKAAGEHIADSGKYELIVPQYYVVENFSKNEKINKVIIGGDAPASDDDKTLLLFGPVGSGKTSAVTSMINYLYDVKKENPFRFVLDEHVNATTGLTAYVFNNTVLPYNVTIVDTPGVEDKMGNKTVSRLIKQWFEKELIGSGTFRLDAISIVLKHDDNQLGWPFIYELADVKRMFGDDLKTNVLPIITNSEVLPQPIAIKSLTQANISFLEYYKVNNIGFEPSPSGVSKLQHNLFWTHGTASLENLFRDLQETVHPLVAILRHNKGQKVETAPSLANKVLY